MVYCAQVKSLHVYVIRQLRSIENVTWQDKVTSREILRCTGLPSMADILIEKGVRRQGHVHRMNEESLPGSYCL